MPWKNLQEDIAEEFEIAQAPTYEDLTKAEGMVHNQTSAVKRQVRRALQKVAGSEQHKKRLQANKESARRRRAKRNA